MTRAYHEEVVEHSQPPPIFNNKSFLLKLKFFVTQIGILKSCLVVSSCCVQFIFSSYLPHQTIINVTNRSSIYQNRWKKYNADYFQLLFFPNFFFTSLIFQISSLLIYIEIFQHGKQSCIVQNSFFKLERVFFIKRK